MYILLDLYAGLPVDNETTHTFLGVFDDLMEAQDASSRILPLKNAHWSKGKIQNISSSIFDYLQGIEPEPVYYHRFGPLGHEHAILEF